MKSFREFPLYLLTYKYVVVKLCNLETTLS